MPDHLISNKGRDQHAACDHKIRVRLVETVGAVTCRRCRALIVRMYGEGAQQMFRRVDELAADERKGDV